MAGGFDLTRVVDLIKDRITNVEEPVCLPDLNNLHLKSEQFDVKIDLKNIEARDIQDLEIVKIEFNYQESTVRWEVVHENFIVDCDYQVDGKHQGNKLVGKGHAHFNVINYKDSGIARFERRGTTIEITELKIRLSVERVEFKKEGLKFNSMTPQESKQFLENSIQQLMREKEDVINDYMSVRVKNKLNEMLSADLMSLTREHDFTH